MKKFLALLLIAITGIARASERVSPDVAARMLDEGKTFVLDVRTPEEYDRGHLAGSILIPIDRLNSRLKELPADKSRPVLVYCAVGGRSAKAARFLYKKGFKNVYDLEGGIEAWTSAGKPVVP